MRRVTPGIAVTARISDDLNDPETWRPLTPLSIVSHGDKTALVTVEDPLYASDAVPRFVRLEVIAQ